MKFFNQPFRSFLILITAFSFLAGCGRQGKENENTALATPSSPHAGGEKYAVEKKESVVMYKGSMAMASKGSHTGYVYLSDGELLMEENQLVGGSVVVDMNSIADIKHGSDNGLVRHLKSPDFFDVAKFPVATFAITLVVPSNGERVNVTGNLTVKGITHAVTFPAQLEVKDGVVRANGKVTIDRTRWGVRYGSGKLFSVLADEVIADGIEFEMKVVAKKEVQ